MSVSVVWKVASNSVVYNMPSIVKANMYRNAQNILWLANT